VKILFDGKNLSLFEGTGIATYARNMVALCNSLNYSTSVLYGERSKSYKNALLHEIAFFDRDLITPKFIRFMLDLVQTVREIQHVTPHRVPMTGRVIIDTYRPRMPATDELWNSFALYSRAHDFYRLSKLFKTVHNTMKADVAHWTFPVPLQLNNAANVYTIHDLVPLRLPYTTLDDKRLFYHLVKSVIDRADLVLTVSEHSRRDITTMFERATGKVVNLYQPVTIPQRFLASDATYVADSLLGLHGLTYKKYILFYGAIEPKKNVGRLIEAYLTSGLDIPLVIAGKDGWLIEDELRQISLPSVRYLQTTGEVTREKQRIVRIGYTSFEQLVNLIRGAKLLAFPSLYEGFGLPIVEGMTCGTPVLTSNMGATREIGGDAALLIDPYNVRDIRDGLLALCQQHVAAPFQARGVTRAADFAPERISEQTRAAYDMAAARRRRRS
jgi:glycosyltransferase involved in cell wall biosynthesis